MRHATGKVTLITIIVAISVATLASPVFFPVAKHFYVLDSVMYRLREGGARLFIAVRRLWKRSFLTVTALRERFAFFFFFPVVV